jgi:DNA-binding SARP family transcriptional activator/tetratricopeptide (TPR) repeat protein
MDTEGVGIYVLGPIRVVRDGRAVPLEGIKLRALLAMLALHANSVLDSGYLIEELWEDRPPATASPTLHAYISKLRRALATGEPDASCRLLTHRPGYELVLDPDRLDAARFQHLVEESGRLMRAGQLDAAASRLREGLSLWRGPAYAEFASHRFAQPEAVRLEELRLTALEDRLNVDLLLGRHTEVIGDIERLVREQPLRERPREQLMLALYRSGRQAEALHAYRDAHQLLVEELGVEPGPGLQRLQKQILAADPSLDLVETSKSDRMPGRSAPAVDQTRFPTALPPVWNIPYRRDPAFTGREQILVQLAEQLDRGASTLAQAVQGGGGVGKTALATEYAYHHRSEFDTVWWVRAEQPTALVSDYANLAAALGLPEAGQADQPLLVLAVRRWLDSHDRWLLILDNADSPDAATGLATPLAQLVDLIPQVLQGQVLVTTRDAGWETHADLVELGVFSPAEAVRFLQVRSGSTDQATGAEIAEVLGFLPLALEQAGAYIRETRLSLAGYLDRLQQHPSLAIAKGRPRNRDPRDTVATTWQVSLERVRPTPGAVELLEVCAFLGPDGIPRELFNQQLDPPAEQLNVLATDPFALDEAIAALHRFGLAKANEQALYVHRLLQQVIRHQLDPAQRKRAATTALRLVRGAFPPERTDFVDVGAWPIYARLLPQALTVTGHTDQLGVDSEATAWLLNEAGMYLWQRGDYRQARLLVERALAIREAYLGSDHPHTARSLNCLGCILDQQGDPQNAAALHERALAIREARLDANDSNTGFDVGESLHNLALNLRDRGNLQRARPLGERAVTLTETSLGPDHAFTAVVLAGLAHILHEEGDLVGARAHHERALVILEASVGPDHPFIPRMLDNLGAVLAAQGDLEGARTLHERALTGLEARLGSDHPFTARGLDNLGVVLAAQGDFDGARTLHERALRIREGRLEPNHPDIAQSLSHLGDVLAAQGDLDGTRSLHERAFRIREARLVPKPP